MCNTFDYVFVHTVAILSLQADEGYCIGPAPSSESYLSMNKIMDVALSTGSQVWMLFFITILSGLPLYVGHSPWVWIPVREQAFFRSLLAKWSRIHWTTCACYRENGY